MLDSGAAVVAILAFAGTVGSALYKLVRWGFRQDTAIFNLQKEAQMMAGKLSELEHRVQAQDDSMREMAWAGRVFVLPRGKQRQRERSIDERLLRGLATEDEEP